MAKLNKIWIKTAEYGAMNPVTSAELIENKGIRNSADQGGKRQVTIIAKESWEAMMHELGASLDPSARRANLMVEGIVLNESSGKILHIGACKIKIHGETKPCHRMDQACQGLRNAMKPNWNGGVYGTIIQGGTIHINDDLYFK